MIARTLPTRARRTIAVLFVLLATFAMWSLWLEPSRIRVRRIELVLPGLPAEHDGVRIAVLTDLHVGSPHHGPGTLRGIVDAVNGESPDVALLLGDFVITRVIGGTFVTPEEIATVLDGLRTPHGSFAVLGNHDWWLDARRVAAALEAADITLLEDRSAAIDFGGTRLWFAGVSDLWEGAHDVEAALRDVPTDEPVIVFTHNPDIFPALPQRVTLTLAGHTHGGQVNLPVIGRPVVPSRYGQRYAAGHVVEDGRHLFVSVGTGTSILPVRFRVPPEIVILTLRAEAVTDPE